MARKNEAARLFNVAVVGLSGTEKDKGQAGIGKSCLCNRFMRSLADDYSVEHISVLSQTDFSGRVVNNDHFLYWGEISKYSDEGIEFLFQVIEQTEFIDDASFQPFKGGKMEPYVKRCAATKLTSAEKLMYICKNQLGIEKEYEQKLLPDGKIGIDGFLCVFDVSSVPNRTVEKQVETMTSILANLLKTKKPIVLVTTKNDDANESYVKEAERIVTRKEYKGAISLIETSAHENINVDLAFIALAQMIDRTKGRTKVLPFIEAARTRKEVLEHSTEAFQRLIRSQVTEYRSIWSYTSKKLAQHDEFAVFVDLFGLDCAQRLFRRHVKKLKDEHLAKKVEGFMDLLPDILQEMVPDLSTLRDKDWPVIQQNMKEHTEFNQYFFECPEDTPWTEYDLNDMEESRIPFEVLDTSEAETVFKNHVNALQQEQKRLEWKKQFKQLLQDTGYVTPGKFLSEVRVLFMGRECFEALTESDCQHIYDQHQKDIVEKAKHNFQELLLEHADLFYHFKSIAPTGTITQEDIKEITDALQEDFRYKSLDRLDQDRKLMLFQHLGFVHCPIREHCPAFPNCMDALIERILGTKAHRPSSWNHSNQWLLNSENNQINLVLLGIDGLANELATEIRVHCDDDEFEIDCRLYSLDYRIIDGDVSLPQNSFKTSKFLPNGCFCVYSNAESFEYIRESVEKTLLSNLEQDDRLPFQGLPIVIMFVGHPALDPQEQQGLRDEGQSLADSLQCPFMDISMQASTAGQRFNAALIHEALHQLLESIQHRAGFVGLTYMGSCENSEPDIRIIMCMFCGDPYSVENILGPLLSHQCCFLSGERSIILETFLGDSKRKVEVIISSFHGANAFREELVHGFVLVYSTKRKASLATLNAFSMNIPNLPIQILAVTDSGGANAFFSSDLSHLLITEGNATADRLQAHFMTSTSSCQQKTAFFTPFFKEVWDKKPEIEQAFHMEEPLPLNDSEDGTLERALSGRPLPPPRHESYHITGGSNEGLDVYHQSKGRYHRKLQSIGIGRHHILSGSEVYERLGGEEGNGPDDRSRSDDSEIYSHVDVFNADNELLVKPSDVKSRRKLHLDRERDDAKWMSSYRQHAFTTGRRPNNHVARPKGNSQTLKQPGKLNLKEFSVVTDAIAKMNVTQLTKSGFGHAPLATPESVDLGSDYAQVKDATIYPPYDGEYTYSPGQDGLGTNVKSKLRQRREKGRPSYSDSDSEWSSLERRQRTADVYSKVNRKATPHKRVRKKRTAIPVATPRVPPTLAGGLNYQIKEELTPTQGEKVGSETASEGSELSEPEVSSSTAPHRQKFNKHSFKLKPPPVPLPPASFIAQIPSDNDVYTGGSKLRMEYGLLHDDDSSLDMSSPSPLGLKARDGDKTARRKEKQKAKADEKQEKRRQKLADKEKERDKKKSKQQKQRNPQPLQPTLEDFAQSETNAIPLLLEKCVRFIEEEGLDSEGIYRVPGNRAHVDLLFHKLEEEPHLSIRELDIPVNAVATALKDFFSKRLPPLLTQEMMAELEDISGARRVHKQGSTAYLNLEVITDRSCRLLHLRGLLKRLPSVNFQVLKFIFQHFVKVSENCKLNSMDSKNLAICWWPTLLPIEFSDMGRFEQMRPHLEDIVQTMIDQYPFLFCGKEAFVMV